MSSLLDQLTSGRPLTLTVSSSDPLAEVSVVDGTLKVVARDTGELHAELPAGVYKIRQQLGARSSERTIFLRENHQHELFAPLDVGSPVPKSTIMKPSPNMQRSPSRDAGKIVAERFDATRWQELCTSARSAMLIESGHGSEISLFCHLDAAQRYDKTQEDPDGDELPFTFDLLNANGDSVVDGPVEVELAQLDAGCYSLTVALDPGIHYLTLYAPGRSSLVRLATQQTIVASPGWQTRIYGFLSQPETNDLQALQVDGERISINMIRLDETPSIERMRLIETAKRVLVDGQHVDFADHRSMLLEKFDDPILGLLAAHIILRPTNLKGSSRGFGREASPAILSRVLNNLDKLLSPRHSDVPMHPDIATLLIHLGRYDEKLTISHPPMLLASWRLLIEESLRDDEHDLIQIDSDVERISTHVVSSRPWMRWEAPKATAKAWQQIVSKVRRGLRGLIWDGRLEVLPENLYESAQKFRDDAIYDAIADEVLAPSNKTGESFARRAIEKGTRVTVTEKLKAALEDLTDRSGEDRDLQRRIGQRLSLPRNKVRHMLDTFQTKLLK
ncbi:MAG: hypothetical protein AAF950_16060 [Pseudomonadota bacterium]